ncbi:MAG: helix-turn-helix domain-containing protein [Paludibacteraceae bacterium]|nr:helix-turn-helix domain-containing protein [Paludibacteraceae bacterium]
MSVEERLERIERLVLIGAKSVLDTEEVALMLGISVSRVRHLTSARDIPHYKQGKSVFFKKEEIERWQLAQRIPTNDEIRSQAITHVAKSRLSK